jgi:hypothetical protein
LLRGEPAIRKPAFHPFAQLCAMHARGHRALIQPFEVLDRKPGSCFKRPPIGVHQLMLASVGTSPLAENGRDFLLSRSRPF